ncbi:MAG: hypothetical protein A2Y65_06540 [Deltaproteobacteria bacterium RBG_13_52_11]|nr:MAG: hypothetical protein A2Y65_06540 [Deltaproteobacteria bacterium RBG_13_52_11]
MFFECNEMNRKCGDHIRGVVIGGVVNHYDFHLLLRVIKPAQGLKAVSNILPPVPHRDDNGDIWITRKYWKTFLLKESFTNQAVQKDLGLLRVGVIYQGHDVIKSNKIPSHMRFKNGSPGRVKNYYFEWEIKN